MEKGAESSQAPSESQQEAWEPQFWIPDSEDGVQYDAQFPFPNSTVTGTGVMGLGSASPTWYHRRCQKLSKEKVLERHPLGQAHTCSY